MGNNTTKNSKFKPVENQFLNVIVCDPNNRSRQIHTPTVCHSHLCQNLSIDYRNRNKVFNGDSMYYANAFDF